MTQDMSARFELTEVPKLVRFRIGDLKIVTEKRSPALRTYNAGRHALLRCALPEHAAGDHQQSEDSFTIDGITDGINS